MRDMWENLIENKVISRRVARREVPILRTDVRFQIAMTDQRQQQQRGESVTFKRRDNFGIMLSICWFVDAKFN